MALKKKTRTIEDLTFSGVSDFSKKAAPRNIKEEMNSRNYQKQVIDNFERIVLGINNQRSEVKKRNIKYKNKVFVPTHSEDAEALNILMNDPRYHIEFSNGTWTQDGLYKLFVIYTEDLDYKTNDEKLKDIADGK